MIFVFLVTNLVDCEWDAWKLGKCSAECGGGKRTDTREERVAPAYGGKLCSGEIKRTQDCNPQACRVNNYEGNTILSGTLIVIVDDCFF